MMVGSRWLGQNNHMGVDSPIVDMIKRLVGGTATIFQRMNDQGDILRVTTNVQKLDGNRAIGTYIPAVNPDGTQNPVVSTVMQGKTYHGIAYVVNAWYVTAYEPLYNHHGNIIGALYVGVKQDNIGALRQAIMQVHIGESGYAFVLGGKGDHRGHYIISEKGLRDGENLWDLTDMQSNYFIRAAIGKAVACKSGEATTLRYPFIRPDESTPRWKVASLLYYEPWDWVIGSSVYEDEIRGPTLAIDQGYKAMIRMFCMVALVIAVISGSLIWFFASKMANTLRVISGAATTLTERDLPMLLSAIERVKKGDLTVAFRFKKTRVPVATRDELGTMADAFTSMNMALVHVGEAFTMMVTSLRQSTEQLEQQVERRTLALHESEQKLADIINFLPDATLVVDGDSRVIAWNRAMEKMSGVRSEAMLGKGDFEYAEPFYGRRQPMLIDQVLHPDTDYEKNCVFFQTRREHIDRRSAIQ